MAKYIELPEEVSEKGLKRAKEEAIIALQQEGELTIREAAALLDLTYEGYLALLHKKGLSASNVVDEDEESFERERARVQEMVQEREK